ncbi:MAG: hypothetical protein CMQ24_00880 [Gammaproteobacteria bacterium]|nr:hypothetical protein [Gammaproteobacteria bacterium]
MSDFLEAADSEAALERLHELECTDGLPVVIPTAERVARLILATGMDPDMVLGEMGPMMGIATVEKVAVNAVMAGCIPDHMPLVIAAARAIADPQFDLMEMQATTHCTAPLVIVNGPARQDCGGVVSGFGALGSGHRANASIGRAVRLCMINIGGGRPGTSDMAVHGHPGKYTYCMAEAEERSPFPPLHVSRGFEADDSVVTVIGCEAPHSVIYSVNADDPEDAEKLLHVLSIGVANLATNHAVFNAGTAVVVLGPGHADVLANAGMTREDIAQRLWELTQHPVADLDRYGGQFGGRYPDQETYCAFPGPENLLILVAGGEGLYSMVMPSWGGGAHSNTPVSIKAEMDLFCEVPGLAAP